MPRGIAWGKSRGMLRGTPSETPRGMRREMSLEIPWG